MKFSISYANRTFLDDHPLIEDLLVYVVFNSNYEDLWISDETNLFHFRPPEEISKSLHQVFFIEISPEEILEEYVTVAWLELNYQISNAQISKAIKQTMHLKMNENTNK